MTITELKTELQNAVTGVNLDSRTLYYAAIMCERDLLRYKEDKKLTALFEQILSKVFKTGFDNILFSDKQNLIKEAFWIACEIEAYLISAEKETI